MISTVMYWFHEIELSIANDLTTFDFCNYLSKSGVINVGEVGLPMVLYVQL